MTTVHTLASGSSGNAAVLSCGDTHLLIDAGISCRRITAALKELGLTPADLTAILITHTHSDHISGLNTLLKKTACPLLATPRTCRELSCRVEGIDPRLMGLDSVLERSLVSKSITTPIGIEITRSIEGVEGITILAIILSGIFGAIIAPVVFRYTGIRHPVAQGIGLGSASHAIGTSKAIEMGEQQGAISGLTIGIAGITTVLVVLVLNVFLWN